MCRILLIKLHERDDIRQYIENFALKCRMSKEYQGDGFGIVYQDKEGILKTIKSLKPIWDASEMIQEIPHTTFVLVHARSAFGEKTIGDIECNQPFGDKDFLFTFNGNLTKVQLKVKGKIGAHKIYNLLREEGVESGVESILNNSKYVQALNLIIVQNGKIKAHNYYNKREDSKYFTLWSYSKDNKLVISSEKLDFLDMRPMSKGWKVFN